MGGERQSMWKGKSGSLEKRSVHDICRKGVVDQKIRLKKGAFLGKGEGRKRGVLPPPKERVTIAKRTIGPRKK